MALIAAGTTLLELRKARLQGRLFKSVFLLDRPRFRAQVAQNLAVEFALVCLGSSIAARCPALSWKNMKKH